MSRTMSSKPCLQGGRIETRPASAYFLKQEVSRQYCHEEQCGIASAGRGRDQEDCAHFAGSLADSCEDFMLCSRCVGHLLKRRTVFPMPVRLS